MTDQVKRMVYGPLTAHKFNVIVEGKRQQMIDQYVSADIISDYIGTFASQVKYLPKSEFEQLYLSYRDKSNIAVRTLARRKIK